MFYPAVMPRRIVNIQPQAYSGFGDTAGSPIRLVPRRALSLKGQAVVRSAVEPRMGAAGASGCQAGWEPLVDTRGASQGCVLKAYVTSGLPCDPENPPVFDSAGKQIGCLYPTNNIEAPVLAAVDANGNVVDADGKPIVYSAETDWTKSTGASLGMLALAGFGVGALIWLGGRWIERSAG